MLSNQDFVRISLEINLFFQRIMKEHLFFVETSLPPVESRAIQEADALKKEFEKLLGHTVYYANGAISEEAIQSNEFVTPYTLKAEELNATLTGASLSTEITKAEYKLSSRSDAYYQERPEAIMDEINRRSYSLLKEVIDFQNRLLSQRLTCRVFIFLYPELLVHVGHESEYYLRTLESLLQKKLPQRTLCDELDFWNHIMEEHAQFIDGMLDPTEENLKETASATAKAFDRLTEACTNTAERQIILNSTAAVQGIRDYKKAAAEGLLQCRIKSIIPPLLADHVLREANHYLRLLDRLKQS